MGPGEVMDDAAVVLGATDRLLGDLADAVPGLRAVGDALSNLAQGLGVEKVVVAVDDAALGRQVFCSGRVPLGDGGEGLFGPAGAWTQPARALDDTATRLLLQAIGIGVGRSTAPGRPPTNGATAVPAATEVAAASAAVEVAPPPSTAPVPVAAVAPPVPLSETVATATARAVRHGWGFTLVVLRGGPGLTEALRRRRRASDTLVAVSERELALLLPETAGDRVPDVLARLADGTGVPRFSYGLACCPADSRDAGILYGIARERLADAEAAAAAPPI